MIKYIITTFLQYYPLDIEWTCDSICLIYRYNDFLGLLSAGIGKIIILFVVLSLSLLL